MGELHLKNSFVILIVITILVLIFLANFVMPPISEKMSCGLQGGNLDKMLKVCAFDPKVCNDAGGISITVPEEQNGEKYRGSSSATTLGCKFR